VAGRFDLVELFANPRLLPSAIVPLLAPVFVPMTGVSIDWGVAATPAWIVVTIVLVQLARQYVSKKPAKVWRGTPRISFVIDVGLLLAATLGLLYATRPWRPEFEINQVVVVSGGFALCGSAVVLLLGPIWVAQSKQHKGPFKKYRPVGVAWLMLVFHVIVLAPVYAGLGAIMLGMIYLEEIVSGGPASLSREAWVVLLTMIGAVPAALAWCYVDLRRRLRR
jgi:hypothetical protein